MGLAPGKHLFKIKLDDRVLSLIQRYFFGWGQIRPGGLLFVNRKPPVKRQY